MAKLKVLQKENCLLHTHIPVHFKQHVGNRISWVDVSNYVLCYHIKSRCFLSKEISLLLGYEIHSAINNIKLFMSIA